MDRFVIALFFLCFSAQAQVPPPGQWPGVGETRSFTTGKHGDDDSGHRWAGWHYLDANGFEWRTFIGVLRRDKVLQLSAPRTGENPADYYNRMWSANAQLPCTDTAISSICDTARAEMAKTPAPPDPVFVVAKNGTSTTRPMYALNVDANTVGAQISKRAPVGARCECTVSGVRKGSTAYCPVWIGNTMLAAELAVCRAVE